jgi:hypothetical protein
MARDFQTDKEPLLDQPLSQPGLSRDREDPKLAEYVVGIEWIKTVPIPDANKFDGMFANRNIVCKLRDPERPKPSLESPIHCREGLVLIMGGLLRQSPRKTLL